MASRRPKPSPSFEFDAEVWLHGWDTAWYFITVPAGVSESIRELTDGPRRGFGSVKVRATIGETSWETSVFPDKGRGAYVLPVKKAVRKAEDLDDGVTAHLVLELIEL